ncbi:MAG: hypothetical protein HYT34_02000 [Candidatus Ryanbacteria bacterium]|nr:hypothetical protein [Candidatus Ryanbacteria bacterium]
MYWPPIVERHKTAFFLLVLWIVFWKALALWHTARRGQKLWYIIFIFVNTLGILEIIYLFIILKRYEKEEEPENF